MSEGKILEQALQMGMKADYQKHQTRIDVEPVSAKSLSWFVFILSAKFFDLRTQDLYSQFINDCKLTWRCKVSLAWSISAMSHTLCAPCFGWMR